MIRLQTTEHEQFCAVLVCDICSERITNHRDGYAMGRPSLVDGAVAEVLHVHKGVCMDKAEHKLGGKAHAGGEGLDKHLLHLVKNVGLSLDTLETIDKEGF